MEPCLWPHVSWRHINNNHLAENEIFWKNRKNQKNVKIVYNSLCVRVYVYVCVCVCVDYICVLLCVGV